jgi:hypothetical protein
MMKSRQERERGRVGEGETDMAAAPGEWAVFS